MPVTIRDRHALIDEILDARRESLGDAMTAYRGHVYRVYHYCRALGGSSAQAVTADPVDRMAVAAAFHDVGIWTDGTLDYLGPSASQAVGFLRERGDERAVDEVRLMVELHHRIRACGNEFPPLVEPFRKADLVDVSFGLIRFGLPREFVREVRAAFPEAGFHAELARQLGRWVVRHPTRPLPMYRW